MATPDIYLLKGPMPELPMCKEWATTTCSNCKKERCLNPKIRAMEILVQECLMWRKVWNWIPSEVRWFVARTGTLIALTMRNYQRHLGVLLETHWTIDEIELGIKDKVYDTMSGEYFFEKKIVRTKLGGVIDIQIIHERMTEEEFMAKVEEQERQEKGETVES